VRCGKKRVRRVSGGRLVVQIHWHVPDTLAHKLSADRRGGWHGTTCSRTARGVAGHTVLARRTTLPPRRTTAIGVRVDCEGGRRSEARTNESPEGGRAEAASASRTTHRPVIPSPLTTPGCLRPHSCSLSSTLPPTGTRPLSLPLPTPVSHPGRRCPAGSASIASVAIGGTDPSGGAGHARARGDELSADRRGGWHGTTCSRTGCCYRRAGRWRSAWVGCEGQRQG
jgi:hypothetical protein